MRLLPRLEDKQKPCASCQTYSVRIPKANLKAPVQLDPHAQNAQTHGQIGA